MRIGSTGTEVDALQTVLQREGLLTGYDTSASQLKYGNFDEGLASNVVAFQEKYTSEILKPYGLSHGTGYVGKSTRAKLNKLYGCGQINPIQPVSKSITITSPNGGETLKVGQTYSITWKSAGVDAVSITFCKGTQSYEVNTKCPVEERGTAKCPNGGIGSTCHSLIANTPAKDGKYSWYIDNINDIGNYSKIEIIGIDPNVMPAENPGHDESDNYFSIASSTSVSPTTCTDSDGGKSYYTIGSVFDSGKNYTDYCVDNSKLKEYFCLPLSSSGLGGVAEEVYTCPNGCSNGACKQIIGGNPSITISSSPQADSNGNIAIKQGDKIAITGVPLNLSGKMIEDYTRAFVFDSIFNGACSNNDWTITCTAKQTGTSKFYIVIYKGNQAFQSNVIQVTVTPSSVTENLPPVIDSVTAPTQLKVNEQGTWVIKAHDPENGYLNYEVNWGDTGAAGWGMPNASGQSVQTNTLQHSYSKAGTYTVTITITDDKSKSVKTLTTVKVVENSVAKFPPCGSYGDINQDGYVSKADSDLVMQIGVESVVPTDWQKKYGDVSGDGTVEAYDASLIMQYNAGIISTFPICSKITMIPRNLIKGWNAISFPLKPSNLSFQAFLAPLKEKGILVGYGYYNNNGDWVYYDSANITGDIDVNQVYLLALTANGTLNFTGDPIYNVDINSSVADKTEAINKWLSSIVNNAKPFSGKTSFVAPFSFVWPFFYSNTGYSPQKEAEKLFPDYSFEWFTLDGSTETWKKDANIFLAPGFGYTFTKTAK